MSLDMSLVVPQMESMVSRVADAILVSGRKTRMALTTLEQQESRLEWLRQRVTLASQEGQTTWLPAGINDVLGKSCAPVPLPAAFTVLATDGSQIGLDRHYSIPCFLINIGAVHLYYGERANAELLSSPVLHFEPADVAIQPRLSKEQPQLIEGPLLGFTRSVEEMRCLAESAADLRDGAPAICLLDGTLTFWGLSDRTYPEFVCRALLEDGLIKHLDALRSLAQSRPVALASYISFPRSTEVVNTLRLALCPREAVDCDRCDAPSSARPCDAVAGVLDRDIYAALLAPGARSPVFNSLSRVVTQHYGDHAVRFFYLNTGGEIARVETPAWVAEDAGLLSLVHAAILDQCRRGDGYPVALSEAHEQAVVTGADREQFWGLVEEQLAGRRIRLLTSAKSASKKSRSL